MSLRLGLSIVCLALLACHRSPAERLARTPQLEIPGHSKCSVGGSSSAPLVVEWSAADRASLEARLARGVVAVRAQDCEVEVLRQCEVPGQYSYLGLTRKNDRVKIRNTDELYAQLPIGAARLEAKLARQGSLDVEIALVGMLEAPSEQPARGAFKGDCQRATHLITGVQIGAFTFLAGGAGEIRGGAGVGEIGAGAASTAARETLSADGEPARCDVAATTDARAPEGCGALIRIELTALPRPAQTPCAAGERWNGGACVSDDAALCRLACTRNLQCAAAAENMATPEGAWRESLLQECMTSCTEKAAEGRLQEIQRCTAMASCAEFLACAYPGHTVETLDNEAEPPPPPP